MAAPGSIPRLLLIMPGVPASVISTPPVSPSAMIYIIKPLQALAQQGLVRFRMAFEKWVDVAEVRAADIVLLCRNIEPGQDWILQECLARGIPMVYDLDDNLWEVPSGFSYSRYHQDPARIAQMERYLRHVQRVRVYSRPLEGRARQFNENVVLVRPCIDVGLLPTQPPPRLDDHKIRLTYVTGRGADDPLIELFAGDLQRLLDDFPGRFEFTWWGAAPERFRQHPDCRIAPLLYDYAEFIHYLAEQGFDIGLAPLTPTSFNLSKTNTKFRDYGACGIAGVYSAVEVYTDCVAHEKTGLLVEQTPGAWYEAILRLANDSDLRESIRRGAYAEIDAHYRQERAEAQWLDTIVALLSQRRAFAPAAPGSVVSDAAALAQLAPNSQAALALQGVLDGLEDPLAVVRQAYLALRPGGQVAILAPYRAEPANLDEYSPLDWSPEPPPVYTLQDNLAGESPHAQQAQPGLDLRCFSIEFFYRDDMRLLSEAERRQARRDDPAVCEAILYRCVAVKPPRAAPDLSLVWLDPPAAAGRRQQERVQELKLGLQQGYRRLDAARRLLDRFTGDLDSRQAEAERQLPLARRLAFELDAFRNRKLLRLVEALRDRSDFFPHQPPEVQRWKDDSLLFGGPLDGYRLLPSLSLTRLSALEWALEMPRPGLRSLSVMPLFDLYPRLGNLRLEVWVGEQRLAESTRPAADIRGGAPLRFDFLPLPGGALRLRLAAEDLDVPLRVYEWRKPARLGLGRALRRPFVGVELTPQP